ncbi:adenosine deaminase [Acrocarpospora sp. B8E8]|uniref:adenosine deaminase n=1 Tax=Acrocarpospora sp. B8E8 TaxID=3153572 RepID=UPI00325CAC37
MSDLRQWVVALPKGEIHTHLESFADATLADLARKAGEPAPEPGHKPRGLTELLDYLDWCCGLVRTEDDAIRIGREFVERAAASGVRTVDVILNPSHWTPWKDRLDELVAALGTGFAQGEAAGGPSTRICLSILRYWTAEQAMELVDTMERLRPSRVVALSIDGNEEVSGPVSARFAPAFARARELGFRTTAHAGESSPASGVWDALDVLGAERIDHGFRSVTDPELLRRLAEQRVPVALCLSQNLTLGWVSSLSEHPLRRLHEAGVRLSLNTDSSFSYVLADEYVACAEALGWGRRELAALARTSIEASFTPEEERQALLAEHDRFVAATV